MSTAQRTVDPAFSTSAGIKDWLGDPNASDLIDWLQGYGLPCVGHDEPFEWLMRSG